MKSRFTEEQIIGILKEQEAGRSVKEILRYHGISQVLVHELRGHAASGRSLADAVQRRATTQRA